MLIEMITINTTPYEGWIRGLTCAGDLEHACEARSPLCQCSAGVGDCDVDAGCDDGQRDAGHTRRGCGDVVDDVLPRLVSGVGDRRGSIGRGALAVVVAAGAARAGQTAPHQSAAKRPSAATHRRERT